MATDDPAPTPSSERPRRGRGPIIDQIVATLAAAAILSGVSLLGKLVSGEDFRIVLLVVAGVGMALAIVALLVLTRIISRPADKPRWYVWAQATAVATIILSLIAGSGALAFRDESGDDVISSGSTSTTTTTTSEPDGPTTSTTVIPETAEVACTSPPIMLAEQGAGDEDFVDVRITVSCPAPEGRTYYLISRIDDIGSPPHTEYYVKEDVTLGVGETTYRWSFETDPQGLHRRLYVVAPNGAQDSVLRDYFDPDKQLSLTMPTGLAPSSNTLEHTKQ